MDSNSSRSCSNGNVWGTRILTGSKRTVDLSLVVLGGTEERGVKLFPL